MDAEPCKYEYGYRASYIVAINEQRIIAKATLEEKKLLKRLWKAGSYLAGKEWNQNSSRETTDDGIRISTHFMVKYRKLLSDIRHREKGNG